MDSGDGESMRTLFLEYRRILMSCRLNNMSCEEAEVEMPCNNYFDMLYANQISKEIREFAQY